MMSGFMFTNDRVFELKEKNGGTELINREEFSGLMVPLFWNKMNQFVVPMLEKMNKDPETHIDQRGFRLPPEGLGVVAVEQEGTGVGLTPLLEFGHCGSTRSPFSSLRPGLNEKDHVSDPSSG